MRRRSSTTKFDVASEKDLRNITCRNYGSWIELPPEIPDIGPIYDGGVCIVSDQIFPGDQRIFYGPPGNFTKSVAEYVAMQLGLMEIPVIGLNKDVLYEVDSLEDMDEAVQASYFQTNDSWNAYYVGLFFNETDGETVPQNLQYELRMTKYWFTEQLYPFLQIPGPRNYPTWLDPISGFYNMDGFTLVQSLVDRFFISTLTGDPAYQEDYEIETQMYPYPPYVQDNGMSQLYGSALPTFVVLSLVLLSPSLIKSVVHEKETGVRELIKLMGMDSWLIWLGWFFHSLIIILIVSGLITLMLKLELTSQDSGGGKLPAILAYSDGSLVWILLLLYGISSIAFCFAIASFFSKPTLATSMGILLWLTSYFIPRTIMDYEYNTMTLTPKILSCLLPNMALTWGFRIIAMFEGRNPPCILALGVQWSNSWATGNPRDQLTLGMVLLMLLLDTFIFLLVTWYVDQVSPGEYGVPEPWYFPFMDNLNLSRGEWTPDIIDKALLKRCLNEVIPQDKPPTRL
ncbi:hypothetical protein SK128_003539 [Halocaridina rubra]|uniref:ABC-2 type transporter transmembrane domain-containing protein n=1 Tax=Halocaridina rubra TaxID=373956 RepID=A0AAN9A726_HALRR